MHATSPELPAEVLPPGRLSRLVADLRTRLILLKEEAWDVNLLVIAAHDAKLLVGPARRGGFEVAAEHLDAIAALLGGIGVDVMPDEATRERLAVLASEMTSGLPELEGSAAGSRLQFDFDVSEALPAEGQLAAYDGFATESARSLSDFAKITAADLTLADEPPAVGSARPENTRTLAVPVAPDWSLEAGPGPIGGPSPAVSMPSAGAVRPQPASPSSDRRSGGDLRPAARLGNQRGIGEMTWGPGSRHQSPPPVTPGAARMAYLLAGETPFTASLEQALTAAGFEVHRFSDAEELAETVGALVPAVVITTPEVQAGLGTVAAAVGHARRKSNAPIVLMTIASDGSIPTRLAAMRAGVDAFLVEPVEPGQIIARLAELGGAEAGEPFRVLIVEDDRPQAVFAESILRKAGIETRAVHDPLEALNVLEQFDPELILMDLRMPGCNGIELTTLIRERDRFVDVPIVFLSGESSAERRYDALAVGGDDYLEKPIKPKFLLSAVTNRVRRARSVRQRRSDRRAAEPATLLQDRTRLVERIGESLNGAAPTTPGGILFLIVDGAQAIRERQGLMAFDHAMHQAGMMLAESLDPGDFAARFGDSSFLVLATTATRDKLQQLAARLERSFADNMRESDRVGLTLAASIGIAAFAQGWRDAAAMINAAERAASRASGAAGGRVAWSAGPDPADAADADVPLRNAILAALAAGGPQLFYQPIASLQGGTDELFQVLMRLRDEGGRRFSAAEIVPMAERCGFIQDLDRAVLSRCIEVLAERAARGRRTNFLISQSIHVLSDTARFEWLRRAVAARGLDPSQLVLELRHDDILPRQPAVAAWLTAARTAGFRVAIGAFEPQPGALQALTMLEIDIVRVSGRFVAQLDPERTRELGDLVNLAHARGAIVVAPMVEDARTAARLWAAGIDAIQGDFVQAASPTLEFDFRAATF